MQASVHSFEGGDGSGSVLLDTGRLLDFDGTVFARSGLRHLRPGQRVSIEVEPPDPEDAAARVTRLWVVGIGEGQPIR
jgi:cold shock CspA family protein